MGKKEGDPPVFRGMTAEELSEAYDVFKTIPDPLGWLQENRERAQLVRDKCKPLIDIPYGEATPQKLDLYIPSGAKNAPVFIDLHGGGWTMGSKDPCAMIAESVMGLKSIFVPIDYGLAPEYSMSQMVEHIRLALAWIYCNIRQYGGDPENLYIFGNSAGAHLAATALMPGWHQEYELPVDVIKGAVLISGVYDLGGIFHTAGGTQEALKMTQEEALSASPLYHLPTRHLPVIVAYGELELPEFIRESEIYAKALEQQGCKVTLIRVPEANHFSIINEMANPEGQLYHAVHKMLAGE